MLNRSKSLPSDAQASEKLALYVYEYLVYSGAHKSAQTFLQEIGWEKHIVPNEAPGFLFSWWSVFWDLYCAAPETRDVLKHSSDARAVYDYPALMTGQGLSYTHGRNGPLSMIQHQQFISQPRQLCASRFQQNNGKIPGIVPMGEQQLETFLSSSTVANASICCPNSNILSLPIASTPTVIIRHQPRSLGPRGPLAANGNAFGPLNSSSSFSGPSPDFEVQPGLHQQQFVHPHPFQQQRSLSLKLSSCILPPQQQQPQWSPDLSHSIDFLGTPQPAIKSEPDSTPTPSMLFMEHSMSKSQHPPLPSSGCSVGDGFAYFCQTEGLSLEGSPVGQLPSSQISQLLSPSPIQQTSRTESTRPKASGIEEAFLLIAPELDLLTGPEDATSVVDGSEQLISRSPPLCQIFDGEPMTSAEKSDVLFSNSNDLQTIQNLVDMVQDPTSADLILSASSKQKPSAALFLRE